MMRAEKRQTPNETPFALPAELSGYLPRAVELSAGGWSMAFVGVLLILGTLLLPLAIWRDRENKSAQRQRILKEGIVAEAQVTQKGRTRGEDAQWYADYVYAAGGLNYTGRVMLGSRNRADVKVGDRLTVRYLAKDPSRSWAAGHEPEGAPKALIALGPLLPALLAGLIALGIRRHWHMLAQGRAVVGRVVDSKWNGEERRVAYEFRSLDGQVRRAWVTGGPSKLGAEVALLYDPERPKRVHRYPLAFVRPARS